MDPWTVAVDGITMELRPTASGGLGLYPEHAVNLEWLAAQVSMRAGEEAPPAVLNLFAHTGLATLALARAGAAVTHVDGAWTAVDWAPRNAHLSGLADRPVRWIVDDAAAFVAREARRGRLMLGASRPPATHRGPRWGSCRLQRRAQHLSGAPVQPLGQRQRQPMRGGGLRQPDTHDLGAGDGTTAPQA